MYNPATAFPKLADAIRFERRHPDYERVNELRLLYYRLITGDGADKLLRQFNRREDLEAFEQRVALTKLVTMPWAAMIMQQFYRPGRLKNVKRTIGYKKEVANAAKKVAEIEDRVSTYWGKESLEKWLATRFVSLSFQDPNAFVVTDFGPFNNLVTKAKPYPIEYSSQEAILFEYTNNVLDYLLVKQTVYQPNPKTGKLEPLDKYTMYLENDIVIAQQLPRGSVPTAGLFDKNNPAVDLPEQGGFWAKDTKDVFQITTAQPRAGQVQAIRPGYVADERTNGRTFVNPFHKATPYFEKSIQETSEMDLSMIMHAIPQKIFYALPCPGVGKQQCLSGLTDIVEPNGGFRTCQRCLGQGVIVHKTATDALAVPMPEAGAPAPPIKLADYVAYVAPPIDILEFLDKHLRSLKQDAIDAVFNSELTTSATTSANNPGGTSSPAAKTATEISAITDKADNTLAPFCEHRATVWQHQVTIIAEVLDNGGPDFYANLEHPSSLTIKTYAQLVAERKAAVDAGAPHYVIQEIDKQLAEMLFSDDDTTIAKIKAKAYFTPFLGKSSEEVFTLISLGKVRPNDEILWAYVDTIFDELGEEHKDFYQLTRERQWALILPKIESIKAELPQPVTATQLPAMQNA